MLNILTPKETIAYAITAILTAVIGISATYLTVIYGVLTLSKYV